MKILISLICLLCTTHFSCCEDSEDKTDFVNEILDEFRANDTIFGKQKFDINYQEVLGRFLHAKRTFEISEGIITGLSNMTANNCRLRFETNKTATLTVNIVAKHLAIQANGAEKWHNFFYRNRYYTAFGDIAFANLTAVLFLDYNNNKVNATDVNVNFSKITNLSYGGDSKYRGYFINDLNDALQKNDYQTEFASSVEQQIKDIFAGKENVL